MLRKYLLSVILIALTVSFAGCGGGGGGKKDTDDTYRVSKLDFIDGSYTTCVYNTTGNPVKVAMFNSSNTALYYKTITYDSNGNAASAVFYSGGTGSTVDALTGGTQEYYYLWTYDNDGNKLSEIYCSGGTDPATGFMFRNFCDNRQ